MFKTFIKKLAGDFANAVKLLKEDDKEKAIEKFEQIAKELEETNPDTMTDTDTPTGDEVKTDEVKTDEVKTDDVPAETIEKIKKFANELGGDIDEKLAKIKKRAYLSIDAQTVEDMMSQFDSLKERLTKTEGELEEIKKTKISKQVEENTEEVKKTSKWGGLNPHNQE